MPRLPDSEFEWLVQHARERHNLSDIVGRHTALKKRGRNEVVGLCCFHSERSPSLEVNDAKGTYHCWGCGAGGDAITFLMKQEGMTFRQAIETLTGDEFPVVSEEERARRKAEDAEAAANRIALAQSIWASAVPAAGTPAEVYARSRGITVPLPPTVRFVMTARWRNDETGEIGRDHPAMACALQDVTGAVVGVQCIFLQDGGQRKYDRVRADGKRAKAKLSFGALIGTALRLGPVARTIIACPGPENGLSLYQQLPGKSVWVACGDAVLDQLQYPDGVQGVCLAGDNDASGRAAVARAREAVLKKGLRAHETFPPDGFKDWNDQLRGIRA
jgi:DNA primase